MVREYKRKPGSRSYRNNGQITLDEAVKAIKSGKMSQREASKHYKIPRATLRNKVLGKHSGVPGHPTILTREEEQSIVQHCVKMSEYCYELKIPSCNKVRIDGRCQK